MNRADAMLGVLQLNEGGWWTRQEIFRWADRYFLTNNAAAELRARGFNVEHQRRGKEDLYRLGTSHSPVSVVDEIPSPQTIARDVPTLFSVKV